MASPLPRIKVWPKRALTPVGALLLAGTLTACVPEHEVLPAAGPPRIILFEAEPPVLLPGGQVTLRWQTEHAVAAEISPIGAVAPSGAIAVTVDEPKDYVLSVRDRSGRLATETLEFQPPHVLMGKLPGGSLPPGGLDSRKFYLYRPRDRKLLLPPRIQPELPQRIRHELQPR